MRDVSERFSVYVVDDDDAVRDSLAALLEPEGFIVRPYASAEDFLNVLDTSLPEDSGHSCLLLDLHMPGKGGQELLEVLSTREFRMPVVVMTGNAYERTRAHALSQGAVAFLEKPVDAEILINTIKTTLQVP